jgi:transaldolase
MPEATLLAFADHGTVPGETIRPYYDHARDVMNRLAAVGVDMDDVVAVLEAEGVTKFEDSWKSLLDTIAEKLTPLA